MKSEPAAVQEFLVCRRFAMVGVSRNPRHFSRSLLRELVRRGYDPLPVNPNLTAIEGRPCFAGVAKLDPPPAAAMIMVGARNLEKAVQGCLDAGIARIWLVRSPGDAAARARAVQLCRERPAVVIAGECPLLYLDSGFPHNFHRWLNNLFRARGEKITPCECPTL